VACKNGETYLHEEQLYKYSTSIITVIKSRTMRWAKHVARKGRGEVHTGVWWGNQMERDDLEDHA
jgi:hypothetical protein